MTGYAIKWTSTIVLLAMVQVLSYWLTGTFFVAVLTGIITIAVCAVTLLKPAAPLEIKHDDALANTADNITEATSTMAIGAAEVSFFIDSLIKDIEHSSEDSANLSLISQQVAASGHELAQSLQSINASLQQTAAASMQADKLLDEGSNNIAALVTELRQAVNALQQLRQSSDDIQRITEVINAVAEQTNLLALNAAIEAARAGEQGRGFAVVAEEVRALAGKTADATKDIADMLANIRQQTQQTAAQMQKLQTTGEQVQQELEQVTAGFTDINQQISSSSDTVQQIQTVSADLQQSSEQLADAVNGIGTALNKISHKGQSVADQAIGLSEQTESIYRELSSLSDHSFYHAFLYEANTAAAAIGKLFEDAISNGTLSKDAVFAEKYQQIANTNPPKYHTGYDSFTDKAFPAIQEPILSRHSKVLYAGAVDRKGYFPTHNNKFSQALTGNYEKDLLQNRTKRIFSDRTGSRCGSHTQSMLLQTYKRDTGEILHDLSVPIYVNGRHWGGFRIGFKR